MEIIINDPKNWLSKRQRQKIRNGIIEGHADNLILSNIEYRVGEGKYLGLKKILDEQKNILTINFTEQDEKDILRQKLRHRLNAIKGKRINHPLDSWKRYYELLNIKELRGAMIPDPPTMVKNKEQLELTRSMDRSGWFSSYLDLCIADEDKLKS